MQQHVPLICVMLKCLVWYFVGCIEQVGVLRKDVDSDQWRSMCLEERSQSEVEH